jgi:hypothetical protein
VPQPRLAPRSARSYVVAPELTTEARVAAALATIDTPWRRLGYRLLVRPARAGVLGMSDATARTLTLYVRRDESVPLLAFTLAHEVAHVVDYEALTEADRRHWRRLRGIAESAPWYTDRAGAPDLATGAGDFAECFAVYEVGLVDFRSHVGGPPTREQLSWLADVAERVGSLPEPSRD